MDPSSMHLIHLIVALLLLFGMFAGAFSFHRETLKRAVAAEREDVIRSLEHRLKQAEEREKQAKIVQDSLEVLRNEANQEIAEARRELERRQGDLAREISNKRAENERAIAQKRSAFETERVEAEQELFEKTRALEQRIRDHDRDFEAKKDSLDIQRQINGAATRHINTLLQDYQDRPSDPSLEDRSAEIYDRVSRALRDAFEAEKERHEASIATLKAEAEVLQSAVEELRSLHASLSVATARQQDLEESNPDIISLHAA